MFLGPTPTILRPSLLAAILKPQDVFAILAQPANAMQAAINALSFPPDLLVGKDRVATGDWAYRDSLRGLNLTLASNTTAAETTWPGYSGTNNRVEYASKIAAQFQAVGIFTHTNGTPTNIDLSSLGVVGDAVVKRRDAAGDWYAWHRSLTAGNNLRLNTTASQATASAFVSVSSTTLTFSASAPSGNYTYEASAHDPSASGIVQCGRYTGNNDFQAIDLGWRAQLVRIKALAAGVDWVIYDAARGAQNLKPNTSAAEESLDAVTFTATGFQLNAGFGAVNGGADYIYLAIRAPY